MADPYSPDNNSWAAAHFDVRHLRDGAHIAYLPIEDDIPRLIGLVAAHWGSFEIRFNLILDGLLRATGRTEPGWEKLAFKRRKVLFVDVVKNSLGPKLSAAKAPFLAACGTAADLHWRRNTVLHGVFRVHFPGIGPDKPTFWSEGVHNGKPVEIALDEATLTKLWHDIAHVFGDITEAAKLIGDFEGWWPPTLPDTEILRVYSETNHPWNPNPDKRTHPPES